MHLRYWVMLFNWMVLFLLQVPHLKHLRYWNGVLPTFPSGSAIFNVPTWEGPPRVLIVCMQNSACTLFALFMCEYLNVSYCQVDNTCDHGADDVYLSALNNTNGSAVIKTTFRDTSGSLSHDLYASHLFTHRILWFRDPVQNIISLSHKKWCENCKGLVNKLHTLEMMYATFYSRQLVAFFDAVLFEPDFYTASLQQILNSLMLFGDAVAAKRLDTISTGRAKARRFGNFHVKIVAPVRRPLFCFALVAAAKLTPTLYGHFYGGQTVNCSTMEFPRHCLVALPE